MLRQLRSRRVNGSLIASIQRGIIQQTGGGSLTPTATIQAVNLSAAIVHHLGERGNAAIDQTDSFAYLTLTNETTVTATFEFDVGMANNFVSYEVIEFVPGVVKSIQSGSINIDAATSNTATLSTDVNPSRALLFFRGRVEPATDGRSDGEGAHYAAATLTLTNGTTVTATRTSNSSDVSTTHYFTVVEFF